MSGPLKRSRVLPAAMVGHGVESYDFVVYGASATIIAKHFFPAGDPTLAILSSLAVYGLAFVVRPLGAAIFGSIGDRLGRRTALSTVVLIMAVSTAAIAVLPTYGSVGVLAPILLLICRLAQGISMGAEYTSAASYVMEQAPPGRRGTWLSAVGSATYVGSALASFVLLALRLISKSAYQDWSWRLAFLAGGLMALVGLYMRLKLDETQTFQELESAGETALRPIRDTFRNWRVFLLLFTMFALLAVVVHNLLGYLPTYLTTTGGVSADTVLVSSGVALLVCAVLCLPAGIAADRVGRKPVLVVGVAVAIVGSLPAYLMASGDTLASTLATQIILVIPAALVTVGSTVVAVELVTARIRATSTALAYNVAYAIFGGTAPILGALLTGWFGRLAPGGYITALAVVALVVVVVALPETRTRERAADEARAADEVLR
ncbi:MFS transporter [Streptomyces hygroscopicus]|uniref:MFS transporter n=1 Tax=Streptomyces hygroscopicus TaxID=1912 RepID=UPI00099F9E01|nr:MFS transporter [Streptomyces sp. NBRC 109436]